MSDGCAMWTADIKLSSTRVKKKNHNFGLLAQSTKKDFSTKMSYYF